MLTKNTHTDKMNKREDPNQPFKFHSKIHRKYIHIVLQCAFISMHQPEKRSCSFFGLIHANKSALQNYVNVFVMNLRAKL